MNNLENFVWINPLGVVLSVSTYQSILKGRGSTIGEILTEISIEDGNMLSLPISSARKFAGILSPEIQGVLEPYRNWVAVYAHENWLLINPRVVKQIKHEYEPTLYTYSTEESFWLLSSIDGIEANGRVGDRGMQGLPGADSTVAGPQGESVQGERGMTGDQGMRGERGMQGPQGPMGAKGATGGFGATGGRGMQGPRGNTGMGTQGPPGNDGADSVVPGPVSMVPGPQGMPGADSVVPGPASMVPGPQGPPGAPSVVPGPASVVPGPQGMPGADSTVAGPRGEPGASSEVQQDTNLNIPGGRIYLADAYAPPGVDDYTRAVGLVGSDVDVSVSGFGSSSFSWADTRSLRVDTNPWLTVVGITAPDLTSGLGSPTFRNGPVTGGVIRITEEGFPGQPNTAFQFMPQSVSAGTIIYALMVNINGYIYVYSYDTVASPGTATLVVSGVSRTAQLRGIQIGRAAVSFTRTAASAAGFFELSVEFNPSTRVAAPPLFL